MRAATSGGGFTKSGIHGEATDREAARDTCTRLAVTMPSSVAETS